METIFCSSLYSQPLVYVVLVYAATSLLILWTFYQIFYILKQRNEIPVKQRGPLLVCFQVLFYSMVLLIPLLVEAFAKLNWINWNAQAEADIPFSRRLVKFVYVFFRTGLSLVIVFR